MTEEIEIVTDIRYENGVLQKKTQTIVLDPGLCIWIVEEWDEEVSP